MNIRTTYLVRLLGVLLLSASTQGYAIPTLLFDGDTAYNSAAGLLSISAELTGFADTSYRRPQSRVAA